MSLGQEPPGEVVGCLQALLEASADIRIDIKSALRLEAADTGKLIQGGHKEIPAALILSNHFLD